MGRHSSRRVLLRKVSTGTAASAYLLTVPRDIGRLIEDAYGTLPPCDVSLTEAGIVYTPRQETPERPTWLSR